MVNKLNQFILIMKHRMYHPILQRIIFNLQQLLLYEHIPIFIYLKIKCYIRILLIIFQNLSLEEDQYFYLLLLIYDFIHI